MKTVDEKQQLLEARIKRLKQKSTFEVGSDYVWNREEIYEDRMPLRNKHSDPDRSGKKE